MKRLSLQAWINKFQLVLVRFPFTLMFIVGLAVLCFLSIQKVNVEIKERLWLFFGLGVLLNAAVTLYLEEFKSTKLRMLLNVISSVLLSVYCFTLPEKLFEYQHFQLVALALVFVLSAFFVSFFKRNNEIPFWNFSKESIIQLIISSAFASVLFGGLGLAILSLDKLFDIHISSKVYSDLSVFSFVLFAPVYFLSNVPDEIEKRKQDVSFEKIIKIFGLYILLPILATYTLILYVYLIQIVFKWQLPNGWVSTLVSVLGLGGFLCMLILHPLYLSKENKVVDRFSKLFPALLFPLLILMSVGIFRRIADYDLTINRLYILILNLWFYGISIYLLITKAGQVKWIVISFATVTFLSSVGPWSVFSLTKNSLTSQLEKHLTTLHMLQNGKVIMNQTKVQKTDTLTALKTSETVRYLVMNYGSESLQPYFSTSLKNKTAFDILEQMNMETAYSDANHYFHLYSNNDSCIYNTGSYPTFVMLNTFDNEKNLGRAKNVCENNQLKIDLLKGNLIVTNKLKNNAVFTIPLKSKIKSLMKESKNQPFPVDKMTLKGMNYKLIMKSIDGKRDDLRGEVILSNFDAYLFLQLDK
jgi:hypothetical protein